MVDFIQKNYRISFDTIKCKYMSLDVNETVYMRRKGTCIFVLSVKPTTVLKLLEKYGCPSICVLKNDFSLVSFSLN